LKYKGWAGYLSLMLFALVFIMRERISVHIDLNLVAGGFVFAIVSWVILRAVPSHSVKDQIVDQAIKMYLAKTQADEIVARGIMYGLIEDLRRTDSHYEEVQQQ